MHFFFFFFFENTKRGNMNVSQHLVHLCSCVGSQVNVTEEISIDDLLGAVSRDAFYRYSGSLTTPSCNEVVVWTVFRESIKVDENLVCAVKLNWNCNLSMSPFKDNSSRTFPLTFICMDLYCVNTTTGLSTSFNNGQQVMRFERRLVSSLMMHCLACAAFSEVFRKRSANTVW